MPSNNCKGVVHYLAGRYEGQIGHLYSPGGFRGPFPWLPYALDNGAFAGFDGEAFSRMCDKAHASQLTPKWVLVPDVVGDRDATLALWDAWVPQVRRYGWPLAFAVQDGMDWSDVPTEAAVVFVGGSTTWKRRTFAGWCARYPRVHVGRINTERWLWRCWQAGAESCDGTGWFRGSKRQLDGLLRYLDRRDRGRTTPEAANHEMNLGAA